MSGAEEIPQSSELAPGPGFRVRRTVQRPDPALVDRFRSVDIALLSDLMNRLYTLRSGLHPLVPTHDGGTLTGPACTVKVFPGDNLMVHAALDFAEPGDVVVVDAAGSNTNAVIGDMVTSKAKSRGIAGFVVDGLVRDVDQMKDVGLPVFARGSTPRGPLHRGPGELNHPISCGGVAIEAGDVVVAGNDGVVVVPRGAAEEVASRAESRTAREEEYVAAVRRGEFSNDWVHETLRAHGCVFT